MQSKSFYRILVMLLLVATRPVWADADGQRIWLDDASFEKPALNKWWMNHATLSESDAHDGQKSVVFDSPEAQVVSNFPFEVKQSRSVRISLWVKNRGVKASALDVQVSVRSRKTNEYIRGELLAHLEVPASAQWQQVSKRIDLPKHDAEAEYFKLSLKNSNADCLIDQIEAMGYAEPSPPEPDEPEPNMAKPPYTPEQDLRGPWHTEVQPGQSNVLIIGDSISIGYTRGVAERLKGEANVFRPTYARGAPVNCGDTRLGLKELDRWLAGQTWDVIHFNWGLHDLCYRHPDATAYGNRDKLRGSISVPLDEYEANLRRLVHTLQSTRAHLIWATTTTVPAGEAGRFEDDEVRYNVAARSIMQEAGVEINDLHDVTEAFGAELFQASGDVHFTPSGYDRLANAVASAIEPWLNEDR